MTAELGRWAQLWQVAAGQHRVFHVHQADRIGIPRRTLNSRAAREQWPRPQLYVLGLPGGRATVLTRVSAALLSAGPRALASHGTAACLWGFGEAQPQTLEIAVPLDQRVRALRGVRVHRTSTLTQNDARIVAGLAATSPARTLCDLARSLDEDQLMERVATAVQDRLLDLRHVRLRREGLPLLAGGRKLDAALARLSEMGRTDSPLERELRALLIQAGLPPHRGTFEVWWRGRLIAVVDVAYPRHRLALEADSREHHFRLPDLYRDDARRNDLAEAGWTLLHFRARDIRQRPGYVIGKVRSLVG